MKKALFGVSAMVLFLAACKNNDDATPEAKQWYISKSIEVSDNGNDTTEISYNTDNTVKEFYSEYGTEFYSSTPVYEGGKIVRIEEKTTDRPTVGIRTSFVYTGDKVARINNFSYDQSVQQWHQSSYDSLVYANGKLAELFSFSEYGYSTKYKLTWEGENVKRYERHSKELGAAEYTLFEVVTNTYDAKPSYHSLVKNNYTWLVNAEYFESLSANNLIKKEKVQHPEGTMSQRTTNTLFYNNEGLLISINSRIENLLATPAYEENYESLFEYTKR